ncbi:MAG: heavy metal sensor histidine kinase [Candidatus Kuenenia sp.]|nr:heavy metal sensor histidine kinase [Candidatus Kuenenia hertensis]
MFSKKEIKLFRTISSKITLWYTFSVLVILVVSGLYFYYRLQHVLNKEIMDILLDESEDILQHFPEINLNLDSLKTEIEKETSSGKFFKITALLYDTEKKSIITSVNSLGFPLKISEKTMNNAKNGIETFETIKREDSDYNYLLLTRPVFQNNTPKYLLQMATSLKPIYKTLENFRDNILLIMPGIAVFTIIGGWFIAKKSLAPVGYITNATKTITALNLHTRLKPTYTGDELEELTNTINLMLDRLEDSFKKIIQFTSDVSHELRTPLASLKAGTEVILTKPRTAEEYRELLENNLIEHEKIINMVNDLLVLLKTDAAKQDFKIINLGKMLHELYNSFKLITETKKIDCSVVKMEDIVVYGDQKLLYRLFSNLLDNAIKYTPSGGNIYISLKDSGNEALVSIKDTGIGISENDQDKIFDRFFRVDASRSRETGGVGLGLSICKNIVDLHKGKIKVKSTPRRGSTFSVTLPKNHFNC